MVPQEELLLLCGAQSESPHLLHIMTLPFDLSLPIDQPSICSFIISFGFVSSAVLFHVSCEDGVFKTAP